MLSDSCPDAVRGSWQDAGMTAALEPEDIEDLRAYIRVQIAAGYAPAAEVIELDL